MSVQRISSITPTICRLMGIRPPEISTSDVLTTVINRAHRTIGGENIEKCLVFAPDAVGEYLFRDFAAEFEPVVRLAPLQVPLMSFFPPNTPVCFASMFTGAPPEAHGIRKYERPVLTSDTLFDALAREGKKVAIAAVAGCSVSLIFLNRPIDYFIEENDSKVNERVLKLLGGEDYDFILAYNQGYDDALHRTTPSSEEAIEAMRRHIASFEELAEAFLTRYRGHKRLVLLAPDHGAHVSPETGKGAHGLDIPDDMEIRTFWGMYGTN